MSVPLPPGVTAEGVGPICVVTGAAGYLGTHLCKALVALGCAVRGFDLHPVEVEGMTAVEGDVRDREALDAVCVGADVVFHTAALMVLHSWPRPDDAALVWEVNVGGTDNALAAARQARVRRFVYTSTVNVCVDGPRNEQDETAPYADPPPELYTETKIAAEKRVLAADGDGMHTIALRPGGIWGPGGLGSMLRQFVEQLAKGRFTGTFGDPEAVVDNTHVYNLVRAELLAAQRLRQAPDRVGGQAFNITDDERINGLEWFRPVVEGLKYDWPQRKIPLWMVRAATWGGELRYRLSGAEPVMTPGGLLKLVASTSFRIDKARRLLGYEPVIRRDAGLEAAMPDIQLYHSACRVFD